MITDHEETRRGLLSMAASLTVAVVKHVANGCHATPADIAAERLAICRACPNEDKTTGQCNLCGCTFMDAKRATPKEACPDGRWPAVE